jgi:hypothetical protein
MVVPCVVIFAFATECLLGMLVFPLELELFSLELELFSLELDDVAFELEEDAILTVSIFPEWTG